MALRALRRARHRKLARDPVSVTVSRLAPLAEGRATEARHRGEAREEERMSTVVVLPNVRAVSKGAIVVSGTQSTVILGPASLGAYSRKTFAVYNLGALTLSGVALQVNPDAGGSEPGTLVDGKQAAPPNPGLWVDLNVGAQNIPAGGVAIMANANAYRWYRVLGTNDQTPSISVSGYCNAQSL